MLCLPLSLSLSHLSSRSAFCLFHSNDFSPLPLLLPHLVISFSPLETSSPSFSLRYWIPSYRKSFKLLHLYWKIVHLHSLSHSLTCLPPTHLYSFEKCLLKAFSQPGTALSTAGKISSRHSPRFQSVSILMSDAKEHRHSQR